MSDSRLCGPGCSLVDWAALWARFACIGKHRFSPREKRPRAGTTARVREARGMPSPPGRRPFVESVWSPNVKFASVASKWRPNHAPLSLLFLASMLVSDGFQDDGMEEVESSNLSRSTKPVKHSLTSHQAVLLSPKRNEQQKGQQGGCRIRARAVLMPAWRWTAGYAVRRAHGEPQDWNSAGILAVRGSSRPARAEGGKTGTFSHRLPRFCTVAFRVYIEDQGHPLTAPPGQSPGGSSGESGYHSRAPTEKPALCRSTRQVIQKVMGRI